MPSCILAASLLAAWLRVATCYCKHGKVPILHDFCSWAAANPTVQFGVAVHDDGRQGHSSRVTVSCSVTVPSLIYLDTNLLCCQCISQVVARDPRHSRSRQDHRRGHRLAEHSNYKRQSRTKKHFDLEHSKRIPERLQSQIKSTPHPL